MPKKPQPADPGQGRLVAGLDRAAAPLALPLSVGAVGYCEPKPPPPQLLQSKLGLLGFSHGNLYAVTFSGDILALPNVAH